MGNMVVITFASQQEGPVFNSTIRLRSFWVEFKENFCYYWGPPALPLWPTRPPPHHSLGITVVDVYYLHLAIIWLFSIIFSFWLLSLVTKDHLPPSHPIPVTSVTRSLCISSSSTNMNLLWGLPLFLLRQAEIRSCQSSLSLSIVSTIPILDMSKLSQPL